jgi:glycosyltransferase involved in cell wall biosynthesis
MLLERGVQFQLEVVGKWQEDGLLGRMKNRICELNLTSRVRILGLVSNEEKFTAFARADVLCHPTFFDTFPVVVLEGMAAGIPVVSTTHSGIPSMIDDGQTGFLVAPRDPAALADRLAWLAEHPDRRIEMGAAGRRKFEREFTLPRHLDRMRSVFLHMAGVLQTNQVKRSVAGPEPELPLVNTYNAV